MDTTEQRISYCDCCQSYTDQRVEEYYIEWSVHDSANPKFIDWLESAYGWWCSECDMMTERVTDNLIY